MPEIVAISLDDQNTVQLVLWDMFPPDVERLTVVDVDAINLFALDAAFEQRCNVQVAIDESQRIIRVLSDRLPTEPPPRCEVPVPGEFITRISTQPQTALVAEVFTTNDPADPFSEESQSLTTSPLLHALCHSAYLANRSVQLTSDANHVITRVRKKRNLPIMAEW